MNTEQTKWKKSSFCAGNACVEVARTSRGVDVRSSSGSPILHFTPEEWRDFINGAKGGEFDQDEYDLSA